MSVNDSLRTWCRIAFEVLSHSFDKKESISSIPQNSHFIRLPFSFHNHIESHTNIRDDRRRNSEACDFSQFLISHRCLNGLPKGDEWSHSRSSFGTG